MDEKIHLNMDPRVLFIGLELMSSPTYIDSTFKKYSVV